MQSGLLSSLIFIPLLASFLILLLPNVYRVTYKWIAIIAQFFVFINVITIISGFNKVRTDYQFLEHVEWIRLFLGNNSLLSIDYILGVDGLSLPMVALSGLIFFIATISSFNVKKREKAYYGLLLLLSSSTMGCFLSVDFFLFFLFFEFMLLPMYFLIGIWGGPNRSYASLKFIIYTLVGSIFILAVMIALVMSNSDGFFTNEYKKIVYSFDFRVLRDMQNLIPGSFLNIAKPVIIFGVKARDLMFFLLLVGFGIKLPMVPFHTWLPDAHVEAPTPISVILAGVLLKIGGYGLIRISYGFFPDVASHFALAISIFGVISIIYGGMNALAQTDFKKLVAYSSISHMGFVLLGIGANNLEGMNGAVFQMFSHGLLSAMLFLIAGVIYDRTKNREIANFKGLAREMPIFTVMVCVAFFGSFGLPLLSGFIGEFFTIFGSFNSTIPKIIPIVSILGIVISAIYFMWTFQRMFYGEFSVKQEFIHKMVDLDRREFFLLASLMILVIVFGVFPNLVFEFINPTLQKILK